MKNPLHNPLPASLSSECKKAAAILESFINPKLKIDGEIPQKIFKGAKGIAIFTALRAGFLGSARFGSGLIVARLPDGSWSAPSAMGMGGVGAGGQFGMELTDFVFVLTTDLAVKTFMQAGSLTLGGNLSVAFGPIGRSAEAGGVLGAKGGAGVFAYSKTRGLYGGVTVEGGFIAERPRANKKFYGRKVRAVELLTGLVPLPTEAGVLMDVLNGNFFAVTGAGEASAEGVEPADPQTTGVIAGGSGEQPQGRPASLTEQMPAPEQVAGQAPQLPELSQFENLGMVQESNAQESNAQESNIQGSNVQESVVDQGLEVVQDEKQDVKATQSSSGTHDHTQEEPERPVSSIQPELPEDTNQKEAKGKEPEIVKPDERPDGSNIEHAH
ncbi:uncharacterized protein N7511_000565 [Penicillium nucicola]|uniref:uncharacterized protein n=1 Tax=Penicillium nucicola TaxID=1850975 RepID=UPI00254536EA|nr:uncharacterized protein N7511_000565 [Penicillium nucicola]KAJ5775554.1 hypothetical protein N7511_000565 [Penicillium nucicola]